MQAKLILIAASATVVISALVVGYATMFGAGASGNFKITGRQYFGDDQKSGYEEISASHNNGIIKFQYTRQGSQDEAKMVLQVVGDMAYEYAYKSANPDPQNPVPAEYVLASCNSVSEGVKGLGGIMNVADVKLTQIDADTFGVSSTDQEIFTIHMVDGTPKTITKGSAITYTVTEWAQDAGEITFSGAIPSSNEKCDGKSLLPAAPEGVTGGGGRQLDATGYSPNQDHWWTSVIGFAKWGGEIGYGSGNVVNEGYLNKMGFHAVEYVIVQNAKGLFFTYSNGQGCGVAIAGTDDMTDAMEDVSAWPVDCYGGGSCHTGFMSHYNKLRNRFITLFSANNCFNKKMIFAGHSLGGATAMTMAHDYIYNLRYVSVGNSIVQTAGNPRPFAYNYFPNLGSTTRQINDQDPIPLLPPNACLWGLGLCYTHPQASVHACTKYSVWNWGGCGWFCPGYYREVRECSYQSNDWNYSASVTGFTHLLTTYFDYHDPARCSLNNNSPF
jgi:hypothetical protein